MTKRQYMALALCQVIFFCSAAGAEEYSQCQARCAQTYTDCMNEPQASDPEVQAVKEASCTQTVQLCNSDCENLRPADDDMTPETNPNIFPDRALH